MRRRWPTRNLISTSYELLPLVCVPLKTLPGYSAPREELGTGCVERSKRGFGTLSSSGEAAPGEGVATESLPSFDRTEGLARLATESDVVHGRICEAGRDCEMAARGGAGSPKSKDSGLGTREGISIGEISTSPAASSRLTPRRPSPSPSTSLALGPWLLGTVSVNLVP